MGTLNEQELKEIGCRVKRGDHEAFHTLYRCYFERYVRYAVRYTCDVEEATDLVQNAFFSLWENLSQYDENKNIFLYLLIIVKNNCLNYLRSIKIKDSHGDKIVEAMLFSGVDDEGVDDDIRARLKQVLQELPDKGRFVLLEHIVEGKKGERHCLGDGCGGIYGKNPFETFVKVFERTSVIYSFFRVMVLLEKCS